MALHVTPGAGKQVPVALHRADSGKPQSSRGPQSALVVQVPESPPASRAPEPLLDPELPPDDPDPPLDPELPLCDPDPPPEPELPEPELPLDEPEAPFDPEPSLDPEPPFDPEPLAALPSAAASPKRTESLMPEQPMAESAVHTATSGIPARVSIEFMETSE
jgi:hypothetical protein